MTGARKYPLPWTPKAVTQFPGLSRYGVVHWRIVAANGARVLRLDATGMAGARTARMICAIANVRAGTGAPPPLAPEPEPEEAAHAAQI
jgi:hypothetical protein